MGNFRKCTKCKGATIRHPKGKDNKCEIDEVDEDEEVDKEEVMRKQTVFKTMEKEMRRKANEDKRRRTCNECRFIANTLPGLLRNI